MALDRLSGPQNIEKLNDKERIARLHHQLGVIFDKVFLTGNWRGERSDDETLRENIFEDPSITDPQVLAEGIHEFIDHAQDTVARAIHPYDQMELEAMQEGNRITFFDFIAHVRDILEHSKKVVNSRQEYHMLKCIDENVHYFRDLPSTIKNAPVPSSGDEAKRHREGLERMLTGLERIVLEHLE